MAVKSAPFTALTSQTFEENGHKIDWHHLGGDWLGLRQISGLISYVSCCCHLMSFNGINNECALTYSECLKYWLMNDEQIPISSRYRPRTQAGLTNRWRLPDALGPDMLGTNQAAKAMVVPLNDHLMRLISAEGEKLDMNRDPDVPYRYHMTKDCSHDDHMNDDCLSGSELRNIWSSCDAHKKSVGRAFRNFHRCLPAGSIPPTKVDNAKPQDIFGYLTKHFGASHKPDAVLHCHGLKWFLHEPFLWKSETLSALYKDQSGSHNQSPVPFDFDVDSLPEANNLSRSNITSKPVNICLNIDIQLSVNALAVVLGNLYRSQIEFLSNNLGEVLIVANLLGYRSFVENCVKQMLRSICVETVCDCYNAAITCSQHELTSNCESWLALNLVPQLSKHIQLAQLSYECFVKVLKSQRLFTFDEFALFKVAAFWLFLQLNPNSQNLPSIGSLVSYFNSLPKTCSCIENEEGCVYSEVFRCLRLHGIVDAGRALVQVACQYSVKEEETIDLYNLQLMNIIPQSWMAKLLAGNYRSLTDGGDMSVLFNFDNDAIREGFVIASQYEPCEHNKLLSMFGFHFELKSVRLDAAHGSYSFHIQRLGPNDPLLGLQERERKAFSSRPERDVQYSICVQYEDGNRNVVSHCSGKLSKRFGLGGKTSLSKVFCCPGLIEPVQVIFSLLFPPS